MSSPSSPRPLSWIARAGVCLPLMALALVVGPAEASQPADGTAGNAAGTTPAGQAPDDRNRGRNCDDNPGAGDGNPAFAACTPALGSDGGGEVVTGGTAGSDVVTGGTAGGDVVTGGTAGGDVVTGGTAGGDVVAGGTPGDVVTSGSGADEVGISWIVITRPVVEVVAAATELPMTNPVVEFAVITPVLERPATAPVAERTVTPPVVERTATTPAQPVVQAPAAERTVTTPAQPVVQAPAAERVIQAPAPSGSSSQLVSAPRSPGQSSTSSAVVPAALPFTGFGTGPVVLLGAGLALIGMVLTLAGRRTRTR